MSLYITQMIFLEERDAATSLVASLILLFLTPITNSLNPSYLVFSGIAGGMHPSVLLYCASKKLYSCLPQMIFEADMLRHYQESNLSAVKFHLQFYQYFSLRHK